MMIQLDRIEDKIECFEATDMQTLEKKINEKIEDNKVLLLHVYSVHHSVHINPRTERPVYSAIVHFKAK
ncbi:YrzA family protein [bacterium LRH843]|nr:YrzA family protein [bacterium LRH843]